MYQVLYRKWRPKTFDDVIGQAHITETLKNEIKSGHIAHAYLFTGSRGTGKTSCAKIFSLAVNCINPIEGSPCGKCDICKEAEKGALLDISEIDAASNNGVENIRSIKEETFLVPTFCKYRVYIIDEAHMLSASAFNAFLKILEEPPSHVIFILATTEPHKILPTIASRCQRFEFHRIPDEDMLKRISYICKKEGIQISDEATDVILKASDGAMRDALSLLDRCASCGGHRLDVQKVEEIMGITDAESIERILKYIINKKPSEALNLVNDLYENSRSMLGLCEGLLESFRQLMIKSVLKKENNYGNISITYILKCMDILQNSYKMMSEGCNAKFEMEILVTKLCYIDFVDKNEKELDTDDKLDLATKPSEVKTENKKELDTDDKLDLATKPSEVKTENKKVANEDKLDNSIFEKTCNINTNNDKIQPETFSGWSDITKLLEKKSRSLFIALKGSRAYKNRDYLLIDSEKDLVFELLKEPSNRDEIKKAIKEVMGKEYKISSYKKEGAQKSGFDEIEILSQKADEYGIKVEIE